MASAMYTKDGSPLNTDRNLCKTAGFTFIWSSMAANCFDALLCTRFTGSLLLPKQITTTITPCLSQLSAELKDFENWYLLGLQLSISTDVLDFIEKTHNTRTRQCIEMARHWINNSKNATWEAVHEALRNIGESVIAEKLAREYSIQPSITRKENLPAQSSEY